MNDMTNIKVGDVVVAKRAPSIKRYPATLIMRKVERVTAKQALLSGGVRIWLKDGSIVGDAWVTYRTPTQEQIDTHKAECALHVRYVEAASWFDSLKINTITVEQLEAMRAAFDSIAEPETTGSKP